MKKTEVDKFFEQLGILQGFLGFMNGQTIWQDENNVNYYFSYDVRNFLRQWFGNEEIDID